jgi:hypothetical protein
LLRAISLLVLVFAIAFSAPAGTQAQSQNPSSSERPTVPPDSPARIDPSAGSGIRPGLSHVPEAFDLVDVRKGFGVISPDFGAGRISSSGSAIFGPVHPNAPWKVGGGFTHAFDNGTVASVGFVGYRNSRVPIFMNQTIGNSQDLTLPLVSFTDLSQTEMQWMLTATVEKTFIRIPGGVTIGGTADVFVPLNRVSPSITVPHTQDPGSIAVRGGLRLGF